MKNKYKAVAMRCTQEQFDSIKDFIPLPIEDISSFKYDNYLINNFIGNAIVTNVPIGSATRFEREVIETFDGKYFLECCGVDVLEDVSEEKIWNSDQIQWRAYDTGDWINASGSVQFRLKPKQNLDADIEALQAKAKELGINLTILIE